MNKTILQLYNSVTKLINILEDEIELLLNKKDNNKINDKKQITNLMQQVLNLTLQLNKLNHDLKSDDNNIDQDISIIQNFLNQHIKK